MSRDFPASSLTAFLNVYNFPRFMSNELFEEVQRITNIVNCPILLWIGLK